MRYLFITTDDHFYEINSTISFKDALYNLATELGDNADLLWKCLNSFGESVQDRKDMVKIFETFSSKCIERVYIYTDKLYDLYLIEKEEEAMNSF